jgi:ParB family transcriptional regulator, chromosome partitioning protein
MGKRINLAELADEEPLEEARVPTIPTGSRPARVDTLALNPLNTRDITRDPEKITTIAESMRLNGQLQSCAVVTRGAFLRIFPEHEARIGDATLVQVTGARRRAAALQIGLSTLKVEVMDDLAASRQKFLGATASENLDRDDLDPIEEARAVELLVKECGSGKGAAEQLSRTPPWVTQRLNLLKLVPELQAALRTGDIPLREVRDLHKLPADQQVATLAEWRALRRASEFTAVNPAGTAPDGSGEKPLPSRRAEPTRSSRTAVAIRRLGGTPPKIAESLRAELSVDDIRALVKLLSEGL